MIGSFTVAAFKYFELMLLKKNLTKTGKFYRKKNEFQSRIRT